MDITLNLRGVRDIERAIARLTPNLRKAAYKAVITAGARVVLREAKARTPKKSGLLKRSLGVKAKVYGDSPYAVIGPRRSVQGTAKTVVGRDGKSRKSVPTPWRYAHMVEYGTSRSRATPFMRPALDASRGKVHSEFRNGLEKYLHRTARRLAKKRSR